MSEDDKNSETSGTETPGVEGPNVAGPQTPKPSKPTGTGGSDVTGGPQQPDPSPAPPLDVVTEGANPDEVKVLVTAAPQLDMVAASADCGDTRGSLTGAMTPDRVEKRKPSNEPTSPHVLNGLAESAQEEHDG